MRVLILPGDGIGPEVTAQARRVLDAAGKRAGLSFDYEEGIALPKKITRLDEKMVTISGFMASEDGREGEVEYFILINDGCGCEGTPMLNEMVFCALPEGEKMEIQPGTVEITGKLYVGETEEDGVVVTLYTMDVESVK